MQRQLERIVIFANGDLPDPEKARRLLQREDYIICADGGTRHAWALHIQPHLIIGDMDSAEPEQLEAFQKAHVPLEIYPHDKNATDLELALNHAIDLNPERIIILAALGGRLDQTLANITLLSNSRLQELDVRLDDGIEEVFLCRDQAQIGGKSGDLVSLIPWQGAALGIQTTGLKWPLQEEPLFPEKTRGLSNEMLGETASVVITSGLLLIVHRRQS